MKKKAMTRGNNKSNSKSGGRSFDSCCIIFWSRFRPIKGVRGGRAFYSGVGRK